MNRPQIFKHVLHVTVLSEDYQLPDDIDLAELQHRITNEHDIGDYTFDPVVPISDEELENELKAMGNDGTFFDPIEGLYRHANARQCHLAGDHLKDCDEDGYCNHCGEQQTVFSGVIKVPKHRGEQLENFTQKPPCDCGRGETLFDEEFVFDDGNRMAVQVVASVEPENEPCWTQGVLFDAAGNELGTTDVGESFLGEYTVSHDGNDYTVVVELEE